MLPFEVKSRAPDHPDPCGDDPLDAPGEHLAPRLHTGPHPGTYDETTAWRQRQTRICERLLMAVDELAAETRWAGAQIC